MVFAECGPFKWLQGEETIPLMASSVCPWPIDAVYMYNHATARFSTLPSWVPLRSGVRSVLTPTCCRRWAHAFSVQHVNVIDAFVWTIPWNQCCIGNKREPCIKTIKSITKIIELQVQTSRRLIFFFHILLRILDSDFTPFTIGKHFAFLVRLQSRSRGSLALGFRV